MARIIALGFFDGVHLGHGALLRHTARLAAREGLESLALTFAVSPGKDSLLLTSVEDRIRLIRSLYGIDRVLCLPFDDRFRTMPWDDFVRWLRREQDVARVVCGYDYRFGAGAEGDPEKLRGLCEALGLGCDVIPRLEKDGITVSSSYLRTLIADGQTERAMDFYGHPHVLSGVVSSGAGLGGRLGFPTANLCPERTILLPKRGVYAVRAVTETGTYPGVCNVGVRPTVHGGTPRAETWLQGFEGDLYGRPLTVEFYRRLRPEREFPSLEALREQILRDRTQALAYFGETEDAKPV